ncbi:MAG: phosphodiesterase, partial [Eggerthellaceae bacterium]|nr:phosphodiesterase [Eggerthellaceae bacterium]
MKFVIASDIHGSGRWCDVLLKAIDEIDPDRILLLGDLLYHGPRNPLSEGYDPPTVAYELSERADKIIAVRGNCDSEVDQMVLSFPCMADYSEVVDGPYTLYLTHGHLLDP